jgi:arylsulfatase A-like enzyme
MLSVALCSCAAAPNGEEAPPAGSERQGFNIALVVIDACRADKLGCYGYERPTSPFIDSVASDPDAVIFRRHYVQGAWTKASTASLFTGLFVHQHGVVLGHVETQRTGQWREYKTQVLPSDHVTLAERLQSAGYETFGVVKSSHLEPEYGFDQGFSDYYTPAQIGKDEKRVSKFVELARRSKGRFFGYLHLNACHHPFETWARDEEYMARFGFGYDEPARQSAGVDFTTAEISHDIKHGRLELDEQDVRFLRLLYDAQLRWTDEQLIGPLIAGLREYDLYDDTLLVITADHGEELYEHRGYAHGHALWDEVVRVPLIVKFPKGKRPDILGQEVAALTRSIDLLTGFLALIGEPAPEGVDGLPVFHGVFAEFAIAETKREWALIREGHKLIAGEREPRLFDLSRDPAEERDLAASEPERVDAMQAWFEELRLAGAGRAVPAPVVETTLTEEAEERLRSLGYLP